jgi:hypothetical protein
MPVEIREIVIKTEITTGERRMQEAFTERDIDLLRKKLLEECKELIARGQKNIYKR